MQNIRKTIEIKRRRIQKLVISGLCIALCFVLPFLTGQIPEIGNLLLPMHIPVFLCGGICGPIYGLFVGLVSPILRSLLFGMPSFFPKALCMSFELACYGFVFGLLLCIWKKNILPVFFAWLCAMFSGRLVWGGVMFLLAGIGKTEFSLAAFWVGAFAGAVPGILIQIVLIPTLMILLNRSHLVYEKKE